MATTHTHPNLASTRAAHGSTEAAPGLHTPLRIGAWTLAHRVVMAPLSRLLASSPGGVPSLQSLRHYAMRASTGGLIVSESIAVSLAGTSQEGTAGLFGSSQVNAWRAVTDEVHRRGGVMLAQLWHGGRLASPLLSQLPAIGASAIAAPGTIYAPAAWQGRAEVPVALDDDGIEEVIDQYRRAAENAADAGFDGVEMSCAHGCLADQFLQDASNSRNDRYGGSVENRARFLRDAVQSLCSVWGPSRVGVRLSPWGDLNGVYDSEPEVLFPQVLRWLRDEDVAYVHIAEPRARGGFASWHEGPKSLAAEELRASYPGVLIATGGFDGPSAGVAIARGVVDAVGFGRAFLANPNLSHLLLTGSRLVVADPASYFTVDSVDMP